MAVSDSQIETFRRYIFASEEEFEAADLPKRTRERVVCLREMYFYWLRNPQLTDKVIAAQFRARYAMQLTTCYEMTNYLKIIIGDTNRAQRSWYQFVFLQRCEEAFAMAREKGDTKAFTAALNALGKYTRLDSAESAMPDYSQIVPQQLEITTDPSVAGFERIQNLKEKVNKMLNKYAAETTFEQLTRKAQREKNLREDEATPPPM